MESLREKMENLNLNAIAAVEMTKQLKKQQYYQMNEISLQEDFEILSKALEDHIIRVTQDSLGTTPREMLPLGTPRILDPLGMPRDNVPLGSSPRVVTSGISEEEKISLKIRRF
jgi:hypothetical protein